MMQDLYSGQHVGIFCHFCGKYVGGTGYIRAGHHLFCRNNGRCKMALFRAIKAYQPSVTAGGSGRPGQVASPGSTGNATRSGAMRPESAEITRARAANSNAKRRRLARR